jgi:hypothetical protein
LSSSGEAEFERHITAALKSSDLLTRGDSLIIRGLYSQRVARQPESAASAFKLAEQEYAKLKDPLLRLPGGLTQYPVVAALQHQNTEQSLTAAIKLIEAASSSCGGSVQLDPTLGETLARLSLCSSQRGDAITAEGLIRTAISKGERARVNNIGNQLMHLNALLEYSALLTKLEWNRKPRKPEAAHLMLKAAKLQRAAPCLSKLQRRRFPANPVPAMSPAAPQSPFAPTEFSDEDYSLPPITSPQLDLFLIERHHF